jgi:hypothetical protein
MDSNTASLPPLRLEILHKSQGKQESKWQEESDSLAEKYLALRWGKNKVFVLEARTSPSRQYCLHQFNVDSPCLAVQ